MVVPDWDNLLKHASEKQARPDRKEKVVEEERVLKLEGSNFEASHQYLSTEDGGQIHRNGDDQGR